MLRMYVSYISRSLTSGFLSLHIPLTIFRIPGFCWNLKQNALRFRLKKSETLVTTLLSYVEELCILFFVLEWMAVFSLSRTTPRLIYVCLFLRTCFKEPSCMCYTLLHISCVFDGSCLYSNVFFIAWQKAILILVSISRFFCLDILFNFVCFSLRLY